MNLYRITQEHNLGYDTYDSAIVVAETAEKAKLIHPAGYAPSEQWWLVEPRPHSLWAHPDYVHAAYVGIAAEGLHAGQVLCASFNAG